MLCCRSEGVLFRLAGLSCIVWAREGIRSVCIREDGEFFGPHWGIRTQILRSFGHHSDA